MREEVIASSMIKPRATTEGLVGRLSEIERTMAALLNRVDRLAAGLAGLGQTTEPDKDLVTRLEFESFKDESKSVLNTEELERRIKKEIAHEAMSAKSFVEEIFTVFRKKTDERVRVLEEATAESLRSLQDGMEKAISSDTVESIVNRLLEAKISASGFVKEEDHARLLQTFESKIDSTNERLLLDTQSRFQTITAQSAEMIERDIGTQTENVLEATKRLIEDATSKTMETVFGSVEQMRTEVRCEIESATRLCLERVLTETNAAIDKSVNELLAIKESESPVADWDTRWRQIIEYVDYRVGEIESAHKPAKPLFNPNDPFTGFGKHQP